MKILSLKSPMILAVVLASTCVVTAVPISLTPASTPRWDGTLFGHNNNDFLDFIASVTSNPELYKKDYTTGGEEKDLSGSYTTVFTSDSAGKITYDGGNIVGPTAYIGFKDGNNLPYSYLFDLSAMGWTGTEEISFSGFWDPGNGGISHVSLFGISSTPPPRTVPGVPDGGTTLACLGVALFGLGSMRRLLAAKA